MNEFTTRDFYGGMNNEAPDTLIPEGQAKLIRNLYLNKDGQLKDICIPAELLDLSADILLNCIKIVPWRPAKVPLDCVDEKVYIAFYSDGSAKMVYRGTTSGTIYTIGMRARTAGTTTYVAIGLTGITVDIDGEGATGTTSTNAYVSVIRRYYEGTAVTVTAAANAGAGTSFFRWVNGSDGTILSYSRTYSYTVSATLDLVAEYSVVPLIRVENADGTAATLATFYAITGDYSGTQQYLVGGLGLEAALKIYPPVNFEVSLDETTWVANPNYIEIAQATANAGMTIIYIRYTEGIT